MTDLAAKELDGAEGREFATEGWSFGIDGVGKYKPEAVVARGFEVNAEHANQMVGEVDGKAREHAPHFGAEGHERVDDERVGRSHFWFGGAGHGFYGLSDEMGLRLLVGHGRRDLSAGLRRRGPMQIVM